MTTIIIKDGKKLPFKKNVFEDLNDFLETLKQDTADYNDPNFVDSVLTDSLVKKADTTRSKIETDAASFFEI